MNFKMIGKYIGNFLLIESVLMLPALVLNLWEGAWRSALAFAASMALLLAASGVLFLLCRDARKRIYAREGLVCVGLGWIALSLGGCLPLFFSGEIPSLIDAWFETVSGFTTTGASILADVERLSNGVLYWRSFTQWIGGMGVLVFLLALAPADEKNGGFMIHLLRAESPGPDVGKLVPHIKETAKILYLIYVLLTIVDILCLLIGRMPPLEAVCTAFGTAGTGGLGVQNDSMASYSPYLQNVTTIFMLLFGVNFSCYYLLLLRRFRSVFSDEELRLYGGVVFASIALITWNLRGVYQSVGEALHHAAFQVATIISTTGYTTADFDQWPSFSKTILLSLMLVGACAGSTAGGLKCGRLLLILKNLRRNIHQILRPNKVQIVRNNGRAVSERVLQNTNAYLAAYALIIVFSVLLVSLDNFSITTNLSAVLACFNNIGPGFDAVGPTCNYGGFGVFSKLVLIMDMLAGRLEIFPILVLCTRSTWSRK